MHRIHISRTLGRLAVALTLFAAIATGLVAQTNPVKLMKGIVSDARSGKPVDGGRLLVYARNGAEPVALSKINPATGAFQVVLDPAAEYRFVVHSPRFLPGETTVRTPGGNAYQESVQNITVQPIPVGESIYAGRAFDLGAAAPKPTPELARALAMLKTSQAATFTIAIAPDAQTPKAQAKPKKGKKGATTEPAPSASGSDDLLKAQANERMQAMKSLLQKEGISLTRVRWELATSSTDARAFAARKENLAIRITGIDVEEVEE